MESIIELQRQEHEEMERYEQALADILNKPVTGVSWFSILSNDPVLNSRRPKQRRGDLRNQHKALDVLNRLADRQRLLKTQYEDVEGYVVLVIVFSHSTNLIWFGQPESRRNCSSIGSRIKCRRQPTKRPHRVLHTVRPH